MQHRIAQARLLDTVGRFVALLDGEVHVRQQQPDLEMVYPRVLWPRPWTERASGFAEGVLDLGRDSCGV